MTDKTYKINNLNQFTYTVKVGISKELKLRLKIALLIIRFGFWVSTLGCKVELSKEDE